MPPAKQKLSEILAKNFSFTVTNNKLNKLYWRWKTLESPQTIFSKLRKNNMPVSVLFAILFEWSVNILWISCEYKVHKISIQSWQYHVILYPKFQKQDFSAFPDKLEILMIDWFHNNCFMIINIRKDRDIEIELLVYILHTL